MIDERLLQKLVDGELTNDEIRELLRAADQAVGEEENQHTWKQLAVAFVEDQLIQRSFADFDSTLESSLLSTEDAGAAADDNIKNTLPSVASSVENAGNNTVWAMVLAAAVLITTAVLYENHLENRQSVTTPTVASSTTNPAGSDGITGDNLQPLPQFDQRTLATLAPDRHLNPDQLPTAFSHKARPQVPLYDAKRFDRRQLNELRNNDVAARRAWVNQVMPNSGVTDQMIADYEKAGLMVNQDIEFLSGRLDDGRSYMIPYRTVKLSPGQ